MKGVLILSYIVFLHQTTTSCSVIITLPILSYIVFLHQTTTGSCPQAAASHCLISSFYIKPQLADQSSRSFSYCLISSFYIKPQLVLLRTVWRDIVLYRLSTSNHNLKVYDSPGATIVLYRLSTSNHNYHLLWRYFPQIVLYRLSTSNHNLGFLIIGIELLSYIVFLHQTTTLLIYSSDYQSVLSYLKQ